jgi:hypothetical protein
MEKRNIFNEVMEGFDALEAQRKSSGKKVAELTGALLDYWVARAEGLPIYHCGTDSWPGNGKVHQEGFERPVITIGLMGMQAGLFIEYMGSAEAFSPSTDWLLGGPLLDKYDVTFSHQDYYGEARQIVAMAGASTSRWAMLGADRLTAACRAIVASRFGDTVPDEVAA